MNNDFLNLTNLKYFCDAVKFGSVSDSARANFVTQSAISQGISKLEKMLGVSLIAHHPKCFRLTSEGEVLFNQAQDILNRVKEFKNQFLLEEKGHLGTLEFACTYSFAIAVIPQYLKKFSEHYPQVKINFRTAKNEQIKRMVMQGDIDFGILPDEGDLNFFKKSLIYQGKLKLYAAKNIKEPKKLSFILAEPSGKERILFENSYLKKFGHPPLGILEASSWEVITNLVVEGMGMGYLPDYIMSRKKESLKEVNLGLETHQYRISAISPVGMMLRKSSQIFLCYFDASFG